MKPFTLGARTPSVTRDLTLEVFNDIFLWMYFLSSLLSVRFG